MNLHLARYLDRWGGLGLAWLLWFGGRVVGLLQGRRIVPPLLATTPQEPEPVAAPRRVLAIKFYGLGNIAMILPTLQAM